VASVDEIYPIVASVDEIYPIVASEDEIYPIGDAQVKWMRYRRVIDEI
jgi:hypothetical protein